MQLFTCCFWCVSWIVFPFAQFKDWEQNRFDMLRRVCMQCLILLFVQFVINSENVSPFSNHSIFLERRRAQWDKCVWLADEKFVIFRAAERLAMFSDLNDIKPWDHSWKTWHRFIESLWRYISRFQSQKSIVKWTALSRSATGRQSFGILSSNGCFSSGKSPRQWIRLILISSAFGGYIFYVFCHKSRKTRRNSKRDRWDLCKIENWFFVHEKSTIKSRYKAICFHVYGMGWADNILYFTGSIKVFSSTRLWEIISSMPEISHEFQSLALWEAESYHSPFDICCGSWSSFSSTLSFATRSFATRIVTSFWEWRKTPTLPP